MFWDVSVVWCMMMNSIVSSMIGLICGSFISWFSILKIGSSYVSMRMFWLLGS